jgi:hypothetical protein
MIPSKKKGPPVPPPPSYEFELDGLSKVSGYLDTFIQDVGKYVEDTKKQFADIGQDVLDTQIPAMQNLFKWAQQDRGYFQDLFVKTSKQFNEQARIYASDEEQSRQRAAAGQDVANSYEAQREAQKRELAKYGALTDPTQAGSRMESLISNLEEAKTQAAVQNYAGEQTKARGRELLGQSAQMNAGLGQQSMAGYESSAGVGNTIKTGLNNDANTIGNLYNVGTGLTNAATNTYGQSANVRDIDYQNKMQNWAGNVEREGRGGRPWGAIGAVGGAIVGSMFGAPAQGAQAGEAGGSAVEGMKEGGAVKAPGSPTSDSGLMRLSDGEYVLPADVVNALGAEVLNKFVAKQTGRKPTTKHAIPVPEHMK